MVTAAGERAGLDVADAQRLAVPLPSKELVGISPASNRKVVAGRSQVFADGHDVGADGCEVVQQAGDLLGGFAEAEHEPGLRDEARRFGLRQHRQAAGVPSIGSHRTLQPGDGLDVVIEHVWPAVAMREQQRQ